MVLPAVMAPIPQRATNTLYLFHTQGEVDDFLAGKAEW
jgi:hypothetical protein